MSHPLEVEYGLTADELLDAIAKRFRAKMALEGAVAEVHMGKQLRALEAAGVITNIKEHDTDGMHDFTISIPSWGTPLRIECKNVRDSSEAFRSRGVVVAYKVETQKTRTSNNDPSSRFYGVDQFDILGVCLGKKTGDWRDFMYIEVKHLGVHATYPGKLGPIQRVPLPAALVIEPWYTDLAGLLRNL